MKKISLLRTDLPQEPEVTLDTDDSTSEVIIGRGTTLRCDDKRVSRKHCLLRILPDGGILLVAIHSNPCFYKVLSQCAIFTTLSKNESITLYQGDEFSLLPESFRYRISMHHERNADGDPAVLEPTIEMLETTQNCVDNSAEADINAVNETSPAMASSSVTAGTPPKRVLPDWLANLPQSNIIPQIINARKRKIDQQKTQMDKKQKNSYNETCRDNTNEQTSIAPIPEPSKSPNVLDAEIAEARVTSVSVLSQLATTEILPGNVQCAQATNNGDHDESLGVGNLARVKIEPGLETRVDTEPVVPPVTIKEEPVKEEPVDDTPNPADVDQGASCSNATAPAAAAAAREMCMYGVGCYRRNPQHRIDLSHPGDPDYDDAADNLPECEYGTSCYRKNVQHRKDFKHTKKMSPPPQPRTRPPQANSMAPNIYCRSCSIVYTVCSRCSGVGVHTHDTVDLTEDDESDEDANDDDCHKYYSDKPPDKAPN